MLLGCQAISLFSYPVYECWKDLHINGLTFSEASLDFDIEPVAPSTGTIRKGIKGFGNLRRLLSISPRKAEGPLPRPSV